jgi:hypothetical protein
MPQKIKEFNMKNLKLVFAVMAIIAIFGFVACGESNGDSTATVAKPTASPGTGSYAAAQSVSLACATNGADIYYSLDNTAPGTLYSGAITISTTTTLKAIAKKSDMNDSSELTARYIIESGDEYKDLEKYLNNGVKNITINKIRNSYSQIDVSYVLSTNIVPGLISQSNAIKNQYNDWRPTGTKSTEFANTIRGLESAIYGTYGMGGGDAGNVVVYLKDEHDNIATALGGLFDNQNDANLFRARLNAFRTASYINQRNQGDRGAGKAAELETLLKQIEQLSGTQIVRGDNTVKVLITDLINTVPETAGPGRYNLLQQLEDFSQLGAWVDDVKAMGLQPSTESFID